VLTFTRWCRMASLCAKLLLFAVISST
jgi:hypothetical protein